MERRPRRKKNKGAPRWMVTYSDMITLILVFFILLFSMSQIDQLKFESITESFQSRGILDFLPSNIPSADPSGDSAFGDDGDKDENDKDEKKEPDLNSLIDQLEEWEKKADALAALMTNVEKFLETEDLGDVITAKRTEEGVILVLQDSILFDSGEANILDTGKPFLDEVGNLLKGIPNKVRVEGHTDTRPISTFRYPSNWELSGARAGSVVRYFSDEMKLNQNRFQIAGYGDTKPVADNDSSASMAKNRRVEIVILDEAHELKSNN